MRTRTRATIATWLCLVASMASPLPCCAPTSTPEPVPVTAELSLSVAASVLGSRTGDVPSSYAARTGALLLAVSVLAENTSEKAVELRADQFALVDPSDRLTRPSTECMARFDHSPAAVTVAPAELVSFGLCFEAAPTDGLVLRFTGGPEPTEFVLE